MQTSLLMRLLQLMDNPVVVITLVLVTIGVRLLWARSRKQPQQAAPVSRERRQTATEAAPSVRTKDTGLEIIDTLLIALILVFGIVRPFLLQTFFIPSESMVPTLEISDKLIANKFVYHFRLPARGEVVVFTPPEEAILGNWQTVKDVQSINPLLLTDPVVRQPAEMRLRIWLEEHPKEALATGMTPRQLEYLLATLPTPAIRRDDYIKRVIGLPGDHIRIITGEGVYINGHLLKEPYLQDGVAESTVSFIKIAQDQAAVAPGMPPRVANYASTALIAGDKNELSDNYLNALMIWTSNWYVYQHRYKDRIAQHLQGDEFVVPAKSLFMMGDNRGSSFDSRFWGVIPLSAVKARAVSTFWPLKRLKLL